jgi:glycosyltransferase involved in cell wall biosynthesis
VSPLRIALALESSGPGGAEHMLLQLAQELARCGDEPIVVTMRPGWMTERAHAAGLPVWIVPQRAGLDALWAPRFARRLRRERIDVLHSHEFAMNVYGGVAARLVGVPSIATLHGRHWATEHPRRALAYRLLRRSGMRIVAVSRDLAGFLAPGLGIPEAAIHLVCNGIALPPPLALVERERLRSEVRTELGAKAEDELALAVGNLYPVKDHATLLRAAAHRPSLQVAIAGRGGEEANLRALAAELGIERRVHLLGLRDDIPRLLGAADVFVQPSLSEGLPLAILEAMAAALPVVASKVGGVHEAVLDGSTGVLVRPGDPEGLAESLAAVLDVPGRRMALGQAGRLRALREFSVERMAERYRALYRA